MAHSELLRAGDAIGRMASVGTPVVPCDWPSLLVACRSTLGKRVAAGSLDGPLPLFCHIAVRHPIGISCFFRSRRLPDVFLVVAFIGLFPSGRSAVRSCIDVDMCHHCLPCRRGDPNYASAVASRSTSGRYCAIKIAWNRIWPQTFAELGGSLDVASEPILTAFDLPVAQ